MPSGSRSGSLISEVTDAVLDEVKAWRSRPLGTVYPVVYLDALYIQAWCDRSSTSLL
jgi:transposase-like protein